MRNAQEAYQAQLPRNMRCGSTNFIGLGLIGKSIKLVVKRFDAIVVDCKIIDAVDLPWICHWTIDETSWQASKICKLETLPTDRVTVVMLDMLATTSC